MGDVVAFDARFTKTQSGFIKSRHLDDKAGVAVSLAALKYLAQEKFIPRKAVQFFFSIYEESGHGVVSALSPDAKAILCIDLGLAGGNQNSTEHAVSICAKDGFSVYDFELRKELVSLCKQYGIDYRIDVYNGYQSDGSHAMRSGYDAKVALIGPGVSFSHSYERTHLDALENTLNLTVEYLKTR